MDAQSNGNGASTMALRALDHLAQSTRKTRTASTISTTHCTVLGVPSGFGQMRPGVDQGPEAIRRAGLKTAMESANRKFGDAGDLAIDAIETWGPQITGVRNGPQVLEVCKRHAARLSALLAEDTTPVTLGGDHSISLGTWAALQRAGRNHGLLWVDAHGDFNTPSTSPSGNLHGMVLAHILGHGHPKFVDLLMTGPKAVPENVVLLGVRSLDAGERLLLDEVGITCFTMQDIDLRGMPAVIDDALDVLTRRGREFHVSFDIDVMDPSVAPGTGTPVRGGLSFREGRLLMEAVARCGRLGSLDMMEVNPGLDEDSRTSKVAVDLIASALGRRIL